MRGLLQQRGMAGGVQGRRGLPRLAPTGVVLLMVTAVTAVRTPAAAALRLRSPAPTGGADPSAPVTSLRPVTALQAATINAAESMGAADSLGTVQVGKLADLVLLDAARRHL